MTPAFPLDFVVNKGAKTITVTKEFHAPRAVVWDAYTRPEMLDKWWAPKPWRARTKSMDFRVGGRWLYAMVGPEGEEHWSNCNYLEIKAPESFTGLDGFTDAEGTLLPDMPRMKWNVSFTDKGKTTLVNVLITFDDLAQLEKIIEMGFKEGFTMALGNLDEELAGR